jgi:hypothetical protein
VASEAAAKNASIEHKPGAKVKIHVPIHGEGVQEVEGHHAKDAPGLVIHPDSAKPDRYVVAHAKTGMALGSNFKTREDAEYFAKRAAEGIERPEGADWTEGGDHIAANKEHYMAAVKRASQAMQARQK